MVKTVADASGTTHFFEVFKEKSVLGTAMVFAPAAVALVETVPMIVYYHGHNSKGSIEGYINSLEQRNFRPLLASKQVLLVEPWGGPKSKFGAMATGDGLSTLIDMAMSVAISYGTPSRPCPVKSPLPPSLILAAFSGGGATLNAVVNSNSSALSRLKEVWAFDSFYSSEGQTWVKWAGGNPDKTLRVRVTTMEDTGSPRRENKIIRATPLKNVDSADPVELGHEACPGAFIPAWI